MKKFVIIGIISAVVLLLFLIFNPIEKITKAIQYPLHFCKLLFPSKKDKLAKDLYNAVYGRRIERIKELLAAGADPDYCWGESGWIDSNPLNVVAVSFYDTYYKLPGEEKKSNLTPDIAVLNLLVKAGADINKRPYVWARVYSYNNDGFRQMRIQRKAINESTEPEAMKEQIENYIDDANRLIEAFLKAGANVDKIGHPYPFSYEAMKAKISNKQANNHFAKGSRAINIAIEKGIAWERQVDLLLNYAELDENSLKAAERSGDSKMIEKISKLWKE